MNTAPTHDQGSFALVTDALERVVGPGRPSGTWTKFCCPVHEGDGRHHDPSLSVKHFADVGRTKVECRAGCDDERILDVLGLKVRDLYDNPFQPGTRRAQSGPRRGRVPARKPAPRVSQADRAIEAAGIPVTKAKTDLGERVTPWERTATYPYLSHDGEVLGEVIRKEAQFERGRDKAFSQRRWDQQAGQWQAEGFAKVPFQLPAVLEAIAQGRTIYLVEGEKDVLSAEHAGLTATTNAGGAAGWSPEHAQWLRGARTVVIVADRDAPGYRRAERVMASLKGRVERVRVVQAATGKDLTDHLHLGHEIAELDPIPGLDPYTPIPADGALSPAGGASITPGSDVTVTSPSPTHPPTQHEGDPTVGEGFVAPLRDHPVDTTPDIDQVSGAWARFMQLWLQQLLVFAQKAQAQRAADRRVAEAREEAERAVIEARHEAERKAIETRLSMLRKAGWDNATRAQVAGAVKDAAAWAADSEVAARTIAELQDHVHHRWGLRVDLETGAVTNAVTVELAEALRARETERAGAHRLRMAGDRMTKVVAGIEGLSESEQQMLYQQINAWQTNPSADELAKLTAALKDRKVSERDRTQIRFIAGYLGPEAVVPDAQVGVVPSVLPSRELRRMEAPLVDPGEEVKPRVDALLVRYRDRLRGGFDTAEVRGELAEAVALMMPEDQAIARARGVEIRTDPTVEHKPLWPDHVDREQLGDSIRMYAALAPESERQAAMAGRLDAETAEGLRKQAQVHRRRIDHALTRGKGLHELEIDQIRAVIADADAGVPAVPQMLFVDDRTGASVDLTRADDAARINGYIDRRRVEQILGSAAAPDRAIARTTDEVSQVFHLQAQLGAGRISLPDYEQHGVEVRLDAALTRSGVPEPIRNSVRNYLTRVTEESAITGTQTRRTADQWAQRSERIAADRGVRPDYDSPERRAEMEAGLRAEGRSPDQVAQRMAADAGRANPIEAAVRTTPGKARKTRTTRPGSGVERTQHRGPEEERGLGR